MVPLCDALNEGVGNADSPRRGGVLLVSDEVCVWGDERPLVVLRSNDELLLKTLICCLGGVDSSVSHRKWVSRVDRGKIEKTSA